MKCKYCGAELTRQDEKCPYCGKFNESAEVYIADQKKYSRDYRKTGARVRAQSSASMEIIVRACILGGLILLFIMLLILPSRLTGDTYEKKQKEAAEHYDRGVTQMMEYWEEENYYLFYEYCDSYRLTGMMDGPFLQYHPLMESARCYMFINIRM